MQELCTVGTPYKCKICGEEMLFFVTSNPRYIMDYKYLFFKFQTSGKIYDILSKNEIRYIKCLGCGNKHLIDWSKKFPEQLVDTNSINKFNDIL